MQYKFFTLFQILVGIMPRNRQRKTQIGLTTEGDMKLAVMDVLNGGLSAKAAAIRYNIPRTTLRRYLQKCRDHNINLEEPVFPRMCPNYKVRKIFTEEEEAELVKYLIQCSKLHHGLPPSAAKKLAYDMAKANDKTIPESWNRDQCAGKEWFTAFLKRNPTVSLRTAESTSIARSIAFNKPTVYKFYDELTSLYEKHPSLGPNKIYNVDETALTTVQGSSKVIAEKGQRQVGQVTSSERGTLVTMCGAINALGNCVPPLLIFPRVHFKDFMLKNAPPGAIGAATPTGWISSEVFLLWMRHFIAFSKPTRNDPVLLIMDNHEAHLSYDVIKLAKDTGVILFTLPPHTSHKLQPLDKCVYGPLKRFYNEACRSWLASHPGRRITIYEIAELLGVAYPLAFTQKNCVSAFQSTGIFPINKYVYNDSEFLPAEVTDQEEVPENSSAAQRGEKTPPHSSFANSLDVHFRSSVAQREERTPPHSSSANSLEIHCQSSSTTSFPRKSNVSSRIAESSFQFVSPEILRPLPKAESKNPPKRGSRKRKQAEVLTSTPVMKKFEEEKMEKLRKESLKQKKKLEISGSKQQKKKPIEELLDSTSESESETVELADSDEADVFNDSSDTDADNVTPNSFVLVKFATKKSIKYFVGQVTAVDTDEFIVNFLRKVGKKFVFPNVKDEATVLIDDIVRVLPQPINTGGTNRLQNSFKFPIDFTCYNI